MTVNIGNTNIRIVVVVEGDPKAPFSIGTFTEV